MRRVGLVPRAGYSWWWIAGSLLVGVCLVGAVFWPRRQETPLRTLYTWRCGVTPSIFFQHGAFRLDDDVWCVLEPVPPVQ